MVIVVTVMIPVVFPIIPLSMLVPVMAVLDPAAFSSPIAFIVLPTLIPRGQPACTGIRCTGPVPFVPLPVVANWVPIPFDPDIIATWLDWANVFDTRRRRRTDSNAN